MRKIYYCPTEEAIMEQDESEDAILQHPPGADASLPLGSSSL
jgi:hypothetical protein